MIRVADADLIWPGEMVGISVRGQSILLVNVDGEIHAYRDRCCHLRVKLSEGRLEGNALTCRAHGWSYDVSSGLGLNPSNAVLERIAIEIRDGGIFLEALDG
jgi:toluene monooxygenase system ferredoxin subunit